MVRYAANPSRRQVQNISNKQQAPSFSAKSKKVVKRRNSKPVDSTVYSVERIVDIRRTGVKGEYRYLCKWVGHDDKFNSWEPAEHFSVPQALVELVNDYYARKGDGYTVDYIHDRKLENGVPKYLVRWLGYTKNEDTWEPADSFASDGNMVQEYEHKLTGKNRVQKAEQGAKSAHEGNLANKSKALLRTDKPKKRLSRTKVLPPSGVKNTRSNPTSNAGKYLVMKNPDLLPSPLRLNSSYRHEDTSTTNACAHLRSLVDSLNRSDNQSDTIVFSDIQSYGHFFSLLERASRDNDGDGSYVRVNIT